MSFSFSAKTSLVAVLFVFVSPNALGQNSPLSSKSTLSDQQLFDELVDVHWRRIFPDGGRNVGGPQFFKYVFENLATNHDLFQRYNRFYCGVSGSIVSPEREQTFEVVQVKGKDGKCIVGRYHRCCWPCACDLMKYARTEKVSVILPRDASRQERDYYVLTIEDPCRGCSSPNCTQLPSEVTAYACRNNVTTNGLRASNGKISSGGAGRLIFGVLDQSGNTSSMKEGVDPGLMKTCQKRINANPEQLKRMGGMGNIFVNLALVNAKESYSHSTADLCR